MPQICQINLKHEELKNMFPENTKEHSMKTRNNDLYQVQHANTGRLQDSAIIDMQKLLNNDAQTRSKV